MGMKRLLSLALAAVLLLTLAGCGSGGAAETPRPYTDPSDHYTYSADNALSQPAGIPYEKYALVAAVDGMELYLDPITTRFAVHDGQGGVWFSHITEDEADMDETAYGEYRRAMTSLLSLYVCDENAQSGKEYASTRYSVEDDAYTLRYVLDETGAQIGFRIDFSFYDLWLTVPMVVTLENGALRAAVLNDEIVFEQPETTVLVEMSLLPHFGSASTEDTGYMLVPDGCGGVINFNNGAVSSGAFEVQVYGEDSAFVKDRTNGNEEKTLLPVFGMKKGDNAFLAVVTGCDAYANIRAEVAGINTDRNYVYSRFRFKETDAFPLKNQGGTNEDYTVIDIYARDLPDAAVEYRFLSGDKAEYNGMADEYAAYLAREEGLVKTTASADYVLELFGAVRKKKSVLGIPTTVSEKLTTFAQAQEMLETLDELGLKAVPTLRYRYATGSQIRTGVAEKVDLLGSLGGKAGYQALTEHVNGRGGRVYLSVNSTTTKESLFGSGYIRNVMNLKAYQYRYDALTGYQTSGSKSCLYMPDIVLDKMQALFANAAKREATKTLSVETVANQVYTSFGKTYFSREDTKGYWRAVMAEAKQAGISLMQENAAAYALAYTALAVDTPTQSNHYSIVDYDVPFYQLVVSRFMPCVSQPLNLTSNPRLAFLRCLRSGSVPQFAFVAEDPATMQGTDLEWLFAADFDKWAADVADTVGQWQTVCKATDGSAIASFRVVEGAVTATVYENGATLFVNTGATDCVVEGTTVPAMGWALAS